MQSAVSESPSAAPTRVFVVDDQEIVREGIRRITEQADDMEMCGEASSGDEALRRIPQCAPTVVVLDLALVHTSGLELVKALKTRWPRLRVLIFTAYDEAAYAERSLRAGATGFVMKSEPAARVVAGIRSVVDGQLFLSDAQSTRLLRKLASGTANGDGLPTDVLTDREIEVLEFVGHGFRTRDIAKDLGLSVKTVEWHRAQIKKKLRLRDANELLRYAFQWVSRQGVP